MQAERLRAPLSFLRTPSGAWTLLGLAMIASGAVILHTAHGQTFDIDEFFYYGRIADHSGRIVEFPTLQLEYLFAPYNGHLQVITKLLYEGMFALFGTDYTAFVVFNVLALWTAVGLTFELLRRSVGAVTALPACVLLLFLGFASEVLLWPFDVSTLISLSAGLGAILALRRSDRMGDVLACALLVLSIAAIELGLAFLIGAAVWILLGPNRRRRAWVFVFPALLYGAWWLWASRFNQSQIAASNLIEVTVAMLKSVGAAVGALTGTTEVAPASYDAPITGFARLLGLAAVFGLLLRVRIGRLPRSFWAWLAILGSYWLLMALADRPPTAARYLFVGAAGLLLLGAEALSGRVTARVTALACAVALIALPANVAELTQGRSGDTLHTDAPIIRAEYAMVELAARHVDPEYVVAKDPRVSAAGGGLFIGLSARAYLRASARNGSLADSLPQLRREPERVREIADAALVGAMGLGLEPSGRPKASLRCAPLADGESRLRTGRSLLLAHGTRPLLISLRRFASSAGAPLARLEPGGWVSLTIPADAAAQPWLLEADGPLTICAG